MNYEKESKFLSYCLRHGADKLGLGMDCQGFIKISELLLVCVAHKHLMTLDILKQIVEEDAKSRYTILNDSIRANQGHSLSVNPDLVECRPPATLYHGTSRDSLQSILDLGLQRRSRTHVHLSDSIATALSVAQRRSNPVVLVIDTSQISNFYKSTNDVWLVDSVDAEFISVIGDKS